jgi:hypothetical protein
MTTTREIYNNPDWLQRRMYYKRLSDQYGGKTYLAETLNKRDHDSGGKEYKFPLRLNLDRLVADIHRDLSRGMPSNDDPLIVKAVVEREGDSEYAEQIERLINKIWQFAHGLVLHQEILLDMNIFGGAALRILWEPFNSDLPFRVAPRKLGNPGWIKPVFDPVDSYRMLSCYMGYEISPEVARAKYGISVADSGMKPLYMEHWTKHSYRITIDDQVPELVGSDGERYRLEGENPYGFVPFYYIPHTKSVEMWGDSQIDGAEGLSKEINSRVTTYADIVRSTNPGILWGRDLGAMRLRPAKLPNGTTLAMILDAGSTKGISNSNPPNLDSLPAPDTPKAVLDLPQLLINLWMMDNRLSPAIFGLDDTQSGRITGPAIAQRMWTSVAHTVTERSYVSTVKTLMDRDLLRVLSVREQELDGLGVSMPISLDRDVIDSITVKQVWPPSIPIDRADKHVEMLERLKEGGVGPETYLTEMGIEDVKGEMERILEWLEKRAEIKSKETPVNEFENDSQGGPTARQRPTEDQQSQDRVAS